MANEDYLNRIEDAQSREFASGIFDDWVSDTKEIYDEMSELPQEERAKVYDLGEQFHGEMAAATFGPYAYGARDWKPAWKEKWGEFQAEASKGIWNIFCNLEDNQGVPDKHWETIFNPDNVGEQVVASIVSAALAAAGSVWGPLGTIIGTASGKALEKAIKWFCAKVLDKLVQAKLKPYCKVIPQGL